MMRYFNLHYWKQKYIGLSVAMILSLILSSGLSVSAKAQSLEEFLQITYDNHPELLYQMQGIFQQFDQSYGRAAEGFLPTLSYSYSSSYTRTNPAASTRPETALTPLSTFVPGATGAVNVVTGNTVPTSTDATNSRTKGYGLSLRQNLFSSFRDLFELRQFLDTAAALKLNYYAGEQGFMLNAIDAYLNVIRRKNVVVARLANYESLQGRLDVVQKLYDIGDTTELDLQQSRAQWLSAAAQWEQALADYDAAVANFRRYSATEPEEVALSDIPLNMPASAEEGEQWVLSGNFEVQALELVEKANKSAYRAAQSQAGLNVNFSVEYQDGRRYNGIRGDVTRQASNQATTTTGLTASIPLYDPTASSSIRAAYHGYLRAKNNYNRQRLDALRGFQAAWASYTRAAKGVESQRQAVDAAQIALDNVILQQRAGLRSIVEVLDEETRLIQAKVSYEDARYLYLISAYQVLLGTGRLTAKDLGLQTKYGEQLAEYFNTQKFYGALPGGYTAIKGLFVE